MQSAVAMPCHALMMCIERIFDVAGRWHVISADDLWLLELIRCGNFNFEFMFSVLIFRGLVFERGFSNSITGRSSLLFQVIF